MIAAIWNKQPDMVPVAPDMSNMIPCKLTGKPFWDIYLYQDPPLWKAYINAVKFFGFDGWLPLYDTIISQEDLDGNVYIVEENDERIVTRKAEKANGKKLWHSFVTVYPRGNPPTCLKAQKIGMGNEPEWYRPIEDIPRRAAVNDVYNEIKKEIGDHGVVGINVGIPGLGSETAIYVL